jgi:hypothetical protein
VRKEGKARWLGELFRPERHSKPVLYERLGVVHRACVWGEGAANVEVYGWRTEGMMLQEGVEVAFPGEGQWGTGARGRPSCGPGRESRMCEAGWPVFGMGRFIRADKAMKDGGKIGVRV